MSETVQARKIDKTGWADGPWMTEPDRHEWRSPDGLPCMILRNHSGVLCGYAAVPPGHPWHGKGYGEVEAEAHGGLTYAAACFGHICHVPRLGEPDNVWWLGFDCAHYMDFIPAYTARPDYGSQFGDAYRDLAYVCAEVESLAAQIVKALK